MADLKSQYTIQSIGTCQDFEFLILLLENFGRGQNSEVLELATEKIKVQFIEKQEEINSLRDKNEKLVTMNQDQRAEITVLEE